MTNSVICCGLCHVANASVTERCKIDGPNGGRVAARLCAACWNILRGGFGKPVTR